MAKGFTVWITGLPGSGKTTVSQLVEQELRSRGLKVERLDGGELREELNQILGFSKKDRDLHIRYIGLICKLLNKNSIITIVSAISPYQKIREEARHMIGEGFVEVYCQCPLDVLKVRDKKGLYRKALTGELKNFTGISDRYDVPVSAEVLLQSHLETPKESLFILLRYLEKSAFIPPLLPVDDKAYSEEEEKMVEKRLKTFGYF